MPRYVADLVKRGGAWALTLALGLSAMGGPAVLAETAVSTTVCDPQGATVTLYSPQPGTVSDHPDVTVAGTTRQTSLVTLYVDGQYDGSIAIPEHDQQFTTTIQLPSGAHTIRVDANDICQIANAQAEAQVTFTPPEPAVPPQVPDVNAPGEGTAVQGRPVHKTPLPLPQQLLNTANNLALPPLKALDVVPANSTHIPPAAVARFVGAISTCTLAVFGWPELIRRIFSIGPCAALPQASKNAWMPRVQLGIRAVSIGGFLLLLLL